MLTWNRRDSTTPSGARGAADGGVESLRKKKQHKNYQDEDKKSAINKKINSQIKKPHLKMILIKRQLYRNYSYSIGPCAINKSINK